MIFFDETQLRTGRLFAKVGPWNLLQMRGAKQEASPGVFGVSARLAGPPPSRRSREASDTRARRAPMTATVPLRWSRHPSGQQTWGASLPLSLHWSDRHGHFHGRLPPLLPARILHKQSAVGCSWRPPPGRICCQGRGELRALTPPRQPGGPAGPRWTLGVPRAQAPAHCSHPGTSGSAVAYRAVASAVAYRAPPVILGTERSPRLS